MIASFDPVVIVLLGDTDLTRVEQRDGSMDRLGRLRQER